MFLGFDYCLFLVVRSAPEVHFHLLLNEHITSSLANQQPEDGLVQIVVETLVEFSLGARKAFDELVVNGVA